MRQSWFSVPRGLGPTAACLLAPVISIAFFRYSFCPSASNICCTQSASCRQSRQLFVKYALT